MPQLIELVNGIPTAREALATSAGAVDAGKIAKLDSSGKLDPTFIPFGVGQETDTIIASEALAAGDIVNLWDNAGTINARKAVATAYATKGDAYVLAAVAALGVATVYFEGTLTGLVGLTPGAVYYLSETAGGITSTPPSTIGSIVQKIGKAHGTTKLSFEPEVVAVLAAA